eukprot:NODE_33_length_2312_cov_386.715789_g32_i0.p1 GENE.NODE_33_length_2312_cov_386.715789_g32_i0~~NODE_33_length_2312_cov_386.715789_g32_i0.p1  ORF type:complete len:541 (+),score=94.95 NODE_33_length_2312_cov_386.715789_g32_i0:71-1624(+)
MQSFKKLPTATSGKPDEKAPLMDKEFGEVVELVETEDTPGMRQQISMKKFVLVTFILEVVIIILLGVFGDYSDEAQPPQSSTTATATTTPVVTKYGKLLSKEAAYAMFQDVNVMIFIGFGFLMTFLRKYGYSSIGLTLLLGAYMVQWHVLVEGLIGQLFEWPAHWHKISIGMENLLVGDFAAAAVLITFGAVLGKVSPLHMLLLGLLEIIFYSVNQNISLKMNIADVGGSMVVHCFGAYFGLAASAILSKKDTKISDDNASVYHSDLFAMIGTVFLWMYWPSFNGSPAAGNAQHRVVLNTFLSLTGSVAAAFMMSAVSYTDDYRFHMVDIQNATLAGGVAMGTSANMLTSIGGAVSIGFVSGIISVLGYVYLTPYLTAKFGLTDTCGVNNLHGMPSVLGGLMGVFFSAIATEANYRTDLDIFPGRAEGWTAGKQAGYQILFLLITLVMAIGSGALSAIIVDKIDKYEFKTFTDEEWWETPLEENPYYHDERGELEHTGSRFLGKNQNCIVNNADQHC